MRWQDPSRGGGCSALQRKLRVGFCLTSVSSAFIPSLSLLCIYLDRLSWSPLLGLPRVCRRGSGYWT